MNDSLTQEQLKALVHYDPETGVMEWINPTGKAKGNGGFVGAKVPTKQGGKLFRYRTKINGKNYLVHRLAWLYVYGRFPENLMDHINGDSLDNRICNLREATPAQNLQNQRRSHTGKNGNLLGAFWRKSINRWVAKIGIDGKRKHLGYFDTEIEAHQAYLDAKRKCHEFCTI